MSNVLITVFTPTYNRAYIIENLYLSLKKQTSFDFEWLVVDDGSTDNTKDLFDKWTTDNTDFSIRYYKKENGGKHTAINMGLDLAKGKLFFTVDSDDYLTEDAIEKMIKWEKELPKDKKYCGVAGNLGTSQDVTPNRIFESDYVDVSLLERYHFVDGERAHAFYTEVHKNYKYPVFEGEYFMTEAVAWNRMANDGYLYRYYNDIIWIYEYKEDGLTKAGNFLFLNNPRGYGLWLREKAKFSKYSLFDKLKMIYCFCNDALEVHNPRVIADSIGIPVLLVKVFQMKNKIKKRIKTKS